MFITSTPRTTQIDNYISNFFNSYRSSITALHLKMFKQEDIRGYSDISKLIMQYYYGFYLGLLIYLEVKAGYNTDWNYYIDKYSIEDNRKKLACNGIDLDDILKVFGLPVENGTGIGYLEEQVILEVEPDVINISFNGTDIDITYLLNNLTETITNIS